jgi:hypothetical protein
MTDGVNVDFGLLKSPDYLGDYVNAFKVGRDLQGQGQQPEGFQVGGTPARPTEGAFDPASSVAAMSAAQREQASGRAEVVATLLAGLKATSTDPVQRLAMARHVAMRNPALGIAPASVTVADVSDAGLDAHLARISALRDLLQRSGRLHPQAGTVPSGASTT